MLADYPCYHWVLRDRDTNASWGQLDPQSYFAFMREVLDIVDEHTEPGPFRDRLYARWYRGKMLNRVEKVHSNPDVAHRRALYEAMHELAVERFPESVDAFLPFNLQQRSRLLRAGDYDGLAALADFETALRARARATAVRPIGGRRRAALEAELEPLRFERDGDRVVWGAARLDATDALRPQHDPAAAQAARDAGGVPRAGHRSSCGSRRRATACARWSPRPARVTAATAAAGAPLPGGLWEVHAVVIVAGFRAARAAPARRGAEHLMLARRPRTGASPSAARAGSATCAGGCRAPLVRAIREAQREVGAGMRR